MRIALLIERFIPQGGVEHIAWEVGRGLAAAGDEVHVYAREAAECPEVKIHRMRIPRLWQPLRVSRFDRAVASAAPREAFDVVQSFSRTRNQDVFRAGGGSHADYLERSYAGSTLAVRRLSPRHRLLLAIEKSVFTDSSQSLLCNSEMVAGELGRRHDVPPGRCQVIVNGVDLEHFRPGRRAEARRALALDPAAPVWLFLGHGFDRKGLATALEALQLAEEPGAQLLVAGRDPVAAWRSRAAVLGLDSRVRFLGSRDDAATLLAAADALILPTRYDAFANVCLEAAASGCCVVTSQTNGAAGWLGDACLSVADARDSAGFAQALDALADPNRREALALAARALAEGSSWSHHVESLRTLYRSVAAAKAERPSG